MKQLPSYLTPYGLTGTVPTLSGPQVKGQFTPANMIRGSVRQRSSVLVRVHSNLHWARQRIGRPYACSKRAAACCSATPSSRASTRGSRNIGIKGFTVEDNHSRG